MTPSLSLIQFTHQQPALVPEALGAGMGMAHFWLALLGKPAPLALD